MGGASGPGDKGARHGTEAWARGGLILEKYRYAPGPADELPKHSHAEYQICLSLNFPGVYGYRGASHAVPVGIHPGEVHSARDPEDRRFPSSFRMMYANPALLCEAATEVAGRGTGHRPFSVPRSCSTGTSRGISCGCTSPSKARRRRSNRTCAFSPCSRGSWNATPMCPGWVRTDMGGSGAPRSAGEAANTLVWLATLPPGGPNGGFFRDRRPIPW